MLKTGLTITAYLLAAVVITLMGLYFWLQSQLATVGSTADFDARYFTQQPVKPNFTANGREGCDDNNEQRNAYFGELHIHTAISHDSSSFGNVASPIDAYRFAQGEPLSIRLKSDNSDTNHIPVVQLRRPLDFAAITDHAENFGETHLCLTDNNPAYDQAICKVYRGDIKLPVSEVMQPLMRMMALVIFSNNRSEKICGQDGHRCITAAIDQWDEEQRAAEQAYDRSSDCRFTSFVAYEYSLAAEQANLHRNIIFANDTVPPVPLSSKDQTQPEKLWQWLKDYCIDSGTDCDAISIPHNSNWSSGRMFYPYSAVEGIDDSERQRLSLLRQQVEPLVEIMQVKGDSECRNGLSNVVGGYDELCDFEKLREPQEPTVDCGDEMGRGGMSLQGCISRNSYVRTALTQGLKEAQSLGVNPFEFGIIAATDNHTGASGAVRENAFVGSTGMDRKASNRLGGPKIVPGIAKGDSTRYNPGGLAGIWAEENSRPSLFSAMRRKETFGTSGPRIKPRLFAGWDYHSSICDSADMIRTAYANGVPMGGKLLAKNNTNNNQPRLLISAQKDPINDASNLQKLQIIKGWVDDQGRLNEHVYDVAGDAETIGSLNTRTCEPLPSGYDQLCAVWQDPQFDPELNAVYYGRVVENPSCRWSTYDCLSLPADQQPLACTNTTIPKTIQERAWTSPIWYINQ